MCSSDLNVLSFAVIYAYLGGRATALVRPEERTIGNTVSSDGHGRQTGTRGGYRSVL